MEEGEPAPSSSLDAEGESGGAIMDLMGRGPAGLASAPACWAPQFSLQVNSVYVDSDPTAHTWCESVSVCVCVCVCVCVLVAQSCLTLCDLMDCSLCPWDSPGKNTGVGCHFLFQGIFPTQGTPALQADSLPLSHLGSTHTHTHTHSHSHTRCAQ